MNPFVAGFKLYTRNSFYEGKLNSKSHDFDVLYNSVVYLYPHSIEPDIFNDERCLFDFKNEKFTLYSLLPKLRLVYAKLLTKNTIIYDLSYQTQAIIKKHIFCV